VGLRLLDCWDCGFKSHRGHGCLSVVGVVCCQVELSARADHSSRGVLPSVCVCVSACDSEASIVMRSGPLWGCRTVKNGAIAGIK